MILTAMGLTASMLSPVCATYCLIQLRPGIAEGGRTMAATMAWIADTRLLAGICAKRT